MDWFPLGGCTGLCQRKRMKAQTNNECGQPCTGSLLQTISRRECYPNYDDCVLENRDCQWTVKALSFRGLEFLVKLLLQRAWRIVRHLDMAPILPRLSRAYHSGAWAFQEYRSCVLSVCKPSGPIQQSLQSEISLRLGNQILRETRGCPMNDQEPQECILAGWSEWSPCSASCAGQSQRTRQLPSDQTSCFMAVPEGQTVHEVRACGVQQCEQETCTLSSWTTWSQCSQPCGDGIHSRSREVVSTSYHSVCSEALEEVRPCHIRECIAVDCVWADWDHWSACSCTCGGGTKRRNRVIQQSPRHGGKLCEPKDKGEIAPCATQTCDICVDGRCQHNYGIKWVRTYVLPQEQELYYQQFNNGAFRTAEALREQVIDAAVDEVLGLLRQPLAEVAASRANAALTALHALRYGLCAAEFQDCYAPDVVPADYVLSFCSVADAALAEMRVKERGGHESLCTAMLVPEALERIVEAVRAAVFLPLPAAAHSTVLSPVFLPRELSPSQICDPQALSLGALTNAELQGPANVDFRGLRVPQLSMESILKRIRWKSNQELSRWVVNLGAYDGKCGRGTECYDPANCLVEEQHFHGLLLEGNASMAELMHARLHDEQLLNDVRVRAIAVTPLTVADVVLRNLPVREVDLLKIDVDSMPHDELLRRLLESGLRPKVLHTEIGPMFPPPVSYWREYDEKDPLVYTPRPELVGLNPSLARVDSVLAPFGYELLQVELYDAVWVRAEYLPAFGHVGEYNVYDKWLVGSFCNPGFLRFGENFRYGRYDYRAWAAPELPWEANSNSAPGAGIWKWLKKGLQEFASPEGKREVYRWSEWGSWSACSATCASSYKARHRSVDRHPNFCGKPALGLEDQYEVCTGQPNCIPDRDCVISEWNAWTGCSCKCFGVRERHRRVEQYASGNGRPCSESSLKDVEPCAPGPGEAVPADCRPDPARRCQIGDWEEWQICSHSCGTGERKRSRSILIPAADDGPPCDDETEEVEPCNTQACHMTCIDCRWSEWSMWSDCSHCGRQRYRHRGVIRQANHCGQKCDAQAAKEVGYCKSACLEHYCTWSTWQEMGGCSAQCGPSTRLLQRHLVLTTTEPRFEVERIGDRGGLCRDARGESYSGCPVQAISEDECRTVLHNLENVDGVQGAMFDQSRVVKFGARRCFVLVDPNTEIWKQDVPGGWLDTPCIAGTGRGPIASAGSDGADKWMCLSLENRPLAKGDESMPCSGEQFYQSTCDSSTKCRVECSPVDCVLTDWSAWSEPTCTELCERTRTVARSNECGGTPCAGLLVETKRCWKNCTQPVDCLMGDWGLWEPSECLASSDQRQRERAVVRAAMNGGEPCTGMIRETMGCSQVGDAVADCELSAYGEWSVCTTSCGSGLRTRSRSIQVQASGGGQPCQGPLALLEPCNLGPCPCEVTDAAFSQWEEWSSCNGGMHIRKRKVQQPASCGGDPALGSLTEIRNCGGTIDCEVSPWASWDECDKSCGGGQQERNRQVTQNPQNGGKPCLKDLVETQGCNEIPCQTTSCEVSDWSAWGECSNSCGSGVHERSRTFTHLAQEGGSGCDMPMAEIKPCSDQFGTLEARRLELCPMSDCGCVWRDWSEWSACTCECGGGQKTRNRHIARAPQPGCTPCEPFDKQQIEPCNTQKCEEDECVDALWSPWQDWEPCSITCRGGITWRSRKIVRNANDCGRPVAGASQQHASCNEGVPCKPSVDCEFAEWLAWSACTQECDGVKRRSRQIAVQGAGDGAYCLGPTHQTYPCSTDKGLLEFNSPALYLHLDNLESKNVQPGQAELKFTGVTKMPGDDGDSVNMVVTALSRSAQLSDESTGLYGHAGRIGFEAGSEIEVTFILMRQQDQREVQAKMLLIKFFDVADGAILEAPEGNEAFLSHESVLSSDTTADGTLVVTSQMPGVKPPKDPMSASPQQEMHAAAILWKGTSRASVKFKTQPGFSKSLVFAAKACWRGDCLVSACGRGEDAVDCVMEPWQSWAPCSVSCGRGQRVRTRKVRTMNSHGGRPCHVDLSATEGCELNSCAEACQPQDCKWSEWSDWGACDKCGGQMKRFRNVIRPSQCGGSGCSAEGAEETASCPRKCHELSYCTWGDWRPYGECTATCGNGIKKRTRMLKIVNEPVKSIIGENILGADDLERKLVELTERAGQLQASRSRQLAACFTAGFLGLLACVSFGRRSTFFAGHDGPRYHLAAETESD
ncbi:HMCN1 [Symbiodinium microadriaticum]|nr:HMCN1 [Symbiodinium microadriaticum]